MKKCGNVLSHTSVKRMLLVMSFVNFIFSGLLSRTPQPGPVGPGCTGPQCGPVWPGMRLAGKVCSFAKSCFRKEFLFPISLSISRHPPFRISHSTHKQVFSHAACSPCPCLRPLSMKTGGWWGPHTHPRAPALASVARRLCTQLSCLREE